MSRHAGAPTQRVAADRNSALGDVDLGSRRNGLPRTRPPTGLPTAVFEQRVEPSDGGLLHQDT
jgi:hypothetical protein